MSESTDNGGVMILFTDGEHECNSVDDSDLNDPEVIDRIIESGIRIIAIAIGYEIIHLYVLYNDILLLPCVSISRPKADSNIENLADISNGKTYFIPDGELCMYVYLVVFFYRFPNYM